MRLLFPGMNSVSFEADATSRFVLSLSYELRCIREKGRSRSP